MRKSARKILERLMNGEQLSICDSLRVDCGAIPQRVSDLRKLGIEVLDRHPYVDGKRQAYKVYYMDVAPKPQPRTETVVRAHVRRLGELDGVETEDVQKGLFA